MRVRAAAVAVVLLGLVAGCSGPDAGAENTPGSNTVTASQAGADVKADIVAFIVKRGQDQGRQAGAEWITTGIVSAAKLGTEYNVVAEYADGFIAIGIVEQLAYLVGKFDPQATKVTVRSPAGQLLFGGTPPAASASQ
jgi:hypothetical protein